MRIPTLFLAFFSFFISFSQEYAVSNISEELLKNADAVIRNHLIHVNVLSVRQMEVTYERTVTVLNENGNRHTNLYVGYNKGIQITSVFAEIFDKNGNSIKKLKKRDFLDVSAVDGGTLYSDSRVLYSGYLPTEYPYTTRFTYKLKTQNTGNLPSWSFVDDFMVSTENTAYTIDFVSSSLKPKVLEKNFNDYQIESEETTTQLKYQATNISAVKDEHLRPSEAKIFPHLIVCPVNFVYEGYNAQINNWSDLGYWMNTNLLNGQDQLESNTIQEVRNLVSELDDDLEIARAVYEYVQQNTRYISVQVGIGGLKPISAIEVDRVKYGDCKGLANYTKALLGAVGVKSHYVHVEAGSEKVSFEKEVASLNQGNHVILAIPYEGKFHWIDCTSQVHPFGFIGDFTDDRDVLVMTENGGQLAHTAAYLNKDNLQSTKSSYKLDEDGNLTGLVQIETSGIQYDDHFALERGTNVEIEQYYKNYWSNIDNLSVDNFEFQNDKRKVLFTEDVKLNATKYASKTDNKLVFIANAFNNPQSVPRRYRDRKFPVEISRGYWDVDTTEINIPENFVIESIPQAVSLDSKFGNYSISFEEVDNKIILRRNILIKKGTYPSSDYNAYRSFKRSISKSDNSKIIITKKS